MYNVLLLHSVNFSECLLYESSGSFDEDPNTILFGNTEKYRPPLTYLKCQVILLYFLYSKKVGIDVAVSVSHF